MMRQVGLSAGTMEYTDLGGGGPTLVFAHGLLMDSSVWRNVIATLRSTNRCVAPTLPLGSHRHPMRPGTDLSMRGIAGLLGEFLDILDLADVTLVINDWGGPLLLGTDPTASRISRLVLTPCEAFDNVPPGLGANMVVQAARIPGALNLVLQQLRIRPLRRLPFTWGAMSKRPVPHEVMDAWFRPALSDAAIRADLRKYLLSAPQARRDVAQLAGKLPACQHPTLIAWAPEDRLMPIEHGRRLAALLPRAHLVEILDSYTLVPEDQPDALAAAIQAFLAQETPQ